MEQIQTLQVLRAIAALMVVLYHALTLFGLPGRENLSAGVDLFFVISGFVMVISSEPLRGRSDGWRRFLARRLRRILPLYWGLTLAKAALAAAAPGLARGTVISFSTLAASLAFVPVTAEDGNIRPVLPVGWSLDFEMLFYALFVVALGFGLSPPRWVTLALMPVAIAGLWRDHAWSGPFAWANPLVLEFCAGMAIACWRPAIPAAIAAVLLAVGFLLLLAMPIAEPWRFLSWGGPASLMVLSCVALDPAIGRRIPRVLLAAGDASYALYLIHPFVLAGVAAAHPPPWLGLAVSLPLCLLVADGLHRRVDRPVQRWLQNRPAPEKPPNTPRLVVATETISTTHL